MALPEGVFTRPNTKQLWVRYQDELGRVVRESARTSNPEEAAQFRAARIRACKTRTGLDFLQTCLLFEKSKRLKASTFTRYRVSLNNWCDFLHTDKKEVPLGQITRDVIKAFVMTRRTHNITDATIRRDLAFMSSLFAFASNLPQGPEVNPVLMFNKKQLKEATARRRLLTLAEEVLLLDSCTEETHRVVIILALETGMRSAELMNLRWDRHVDLDRSEISLDVEDTKTSEPRVIPLSQRALEALGTHPKHRRCSYVFWHGDGQRYTTFKGWWNGVLRRSKVKNLCFHDLRHAFASRKVQQGWPEKAVQMMLGHKTSSMTRRYTHLQVDDLHRLLKHSSTV